MEELFTKKERRGENVAIMFIWVAASVTLFALLASVWFHATTPDMWRTLAIMSMGVLIIVNQVRVYRAVRHSARHSEPTLDEITVAVAELIVAERRDLAKMHVELEARITGQLEGTVASLNARRVETAIPVG